MNYKNRKLTIPQQISRAYYAYCAKANKNGGTPMDRLEWENARVIDIQKFMGMES